MTAALPPLPAALLGRLLLAALRLPWLLAALRLVGLLAYLGQSLASHATDDGLSCSAGDRGEEEPPKRSRPQRLLHLGR